MLTVGAADKTVARFISERTVCKNGVLMLDAKTSVSEMAKSLNMGRASFYRALDSLIEKGLIKKNGRRIVVLAPNELLKI